MCLEFGVATGATLRKIATSFPSRSVYGFDSFEGLPEDWRGDGVTWNPKGTYACDPPVDLPNNVTTPRPEVRGFPAHSIGAPPTRVSSPIPSISIDAKEAAWETWHFIEAA